MSTGGNNEPGVLINDVWGNIKINGINRPDIELSSELKDSMNYYNIGDSDGLPKRVGFSISGIDFNEKIKRGDIRKVLVSARIPYTVNQPTNPCPLTLIWLLKVRLVVASIATTPPIVPFHGVAVTGALMVA